MTPVRIIALSKEERPPAGARFLLFEWVSSFGTTIIREGDGLRYQVGPRSQRFWSVEAPHLARRLGLDRVYLSGEIAGPAPTRADPPGPVAELQIKRRRRRPIV
ncbi:MAG: hypothetical protein ABW275_00400 [Hansschlegelia sp.]